MENNELTGAEKDALKQYTEEEKNEILSFTDFYLSSYKIFEESFLYYGDKLKPQKIKKEDKALFTKFIATIKKNYDKAKKREDFLVVFEGRCFRACAMKNTVKGLMFAVRQTNVDFKNLNRLNLGEHVVKELMHKRLNRGGLCIIAGSPGNGKTTTSSAVVIKRLSEYGGLCITVEDPPEFPLHGSHGKGFCIQNQVDEEGGFSGAIKTSMRSYPTGQTSVMFVGEVRDTETAVEVIKASIDGRLVITTLHADSVYIAIKRIATLAGKQLGDEAYSMLSESFRIAIHQNLVQHGRSKNLKMHTECLVNSTQCVNNIKNNTIERLKNEAQMQKNKWKNNLQIDYHSEME